MCALRSSAGSVPGGGGGGPTVPGMKRSRIAVAVAAGFAALTLGACGPADVQDAGRGAAPTSAAAAATSSPAADGSISPSAPATPVTSPTPSTRPATSAPPTTHPASKAPTVRHTTAPPVRRTTAPPVRRTTAPPRSEVCSIRSNAGNCYKAGQFCRKADLGRTTTDASGRSITCRTVSGRPHWQY